MSDFAAEHQALYFAGAEDGAQEAADSASRAARKAPGEAQEAADEVANAPAGEKKKILGEFFLQVHILMIFEC